MNIFSSVVFLHKFFSQPGTYGTKYRLTGVIWGNIVHHFWQLYEFEILRYLIEPLGKFFTLVYSTNKLHHFWQLYEFEILRLKC